MSAAPESDQPPSVGAYLRDWLELQRTRLQPSTVKSYSGNVRRYLEPHLGDVRLHELGVLQLERLWTRLMTCGGEGGRPLSRRSVEYAAATLRSALSDAVRTGVVDRNVAKLARLPTVDPDLDDADGGELQVWTAEQARRFLDARILHVRRALQVVDGHARLKATKTQRSRSIRIDVNVVEVLGRRRRQQQLHRETAGDDSWQDRWGLVFTEADGRHLAPMNVTVAFRWRVRRVDVPTIRLHDLRHTHATPSGEIMRALDRGEDFIVTRNGVPVGELRPVRRRFVSRDLLFEVLRGAPTIDAQRFRDDVDAVLDQDIEPPS